MTDPFHEKTLRSETLFEGKILNLERHVVRLPDGLTAQREIIRHPGAVALLALVEEGQKVLLVYQYRKAVEKAFWEIPAGTLEPSESPLACAQRELIEETGYRAETLAEIARFYTAPGFCDEDMTLFLAERLQPTEAKNHPEDEFLQSRAFSQEETKVLLEQGMICDAKTMVALSFWKDHVSVD